MNTVAIDVLLQISEYLHYRDIINLSRVNHYLKHGLQNKLNIIKNWYQTCANCYTLNAETEDIINNEVDFKPSPYFNYLNYYYNRIGACILQALHSKIAFKHGDVIKIRLGARIYVIVIDDTDIKIYPYTHAILETMYYYSSPVYNKNISDYSYLKSDQPLFHRDLKCWI